MGAHPGSQNSEGDPNRNQNSERDSKIKKDSSLIICVEKIQKFHHLKRQLKILKENFVGKSVYKV